MGKALHDVLEQLNQDLIVLDCQSAGPGQLTQELIFFNSWINCLPGSLSRSAIPSTIFFTFVWVLGSCKATARMGNLARAYAVW